MNQKWLADILSFMTKELILASGSAGRKALFDKLQFPYRIQVSNYEEDMSLNLAPKDLAIELSRGKARDVASRNKNAVVLGADSFAVFKGQLLGKPHTTKRAKEMLNMLSDNSHSFITGFTIIDTESDREVSEAVESKVHFRKISQAEIDNYLSKEDVLQKAAAYTVQGMGSIFITRIEGSFDNIIGLPLAHVSEQLKTFGINLL